MHVPCQILVVSEWTIKSDNNNERNTRFRSRKVGSLLERHFGLIAPYLYTMFCFCITPRL